MSTVPDVLVENRNQHARALHRPAGDTDAPRPACRERDKNVPFHFVETEPLLAFRTLCQNPQCFGDQQTNRGPPDAPQCPSCGKPEHDRTSVNGQRVIVSPCGCELGVPATDGGRRDP